MINGRYIEVPAVPDGNRLVPLWDCDVVFQYGSPWRVEHDGKSLDARKVIEALYDIETKEVSLNVRIVWKEPAKYSVGQRVGVDVGGHTLRVMEITDVQDGREELRVSPGSELRGWTELFQEDKDGLTQIDPKGLEASKKYTFKMVSKKYLFADGTVVEWDHQLYRLEGEK